MKIIFAAILIAIMPTVAAAQNGLTVGAKAPGFKAKDQNGKTVGLKDALKNGKVLVLFYRGHWCPNCSRALKSFQDSLLQLTEKNITVIAVSPETAAGVVQSVKKSNASFSVISDAGLAIMNKYKVAFSVTKDMDDIHTKYGIDVTGNNGSNGNTLPRPSAFLIDQSGTIIYRYFNASPYSNPNSNNRVTVKEILEQTK